MSFSKLFYSIKNILPCFNYFIVCFILKKKHVLQFDKAFKREPAMSNDSVVYPLDFQVLPHIADLYSTLYTLDI